MLSHAGMPFTSLNDCTATAASQLYTTSLPNYSQEKKYLCQSELAVFKIDFKQYTPTGGNIILKVYLFILLIRYITTGIRVR